MEKPQNISMQQAIEILNHMGYTYISSQEATQRRYNLQCVILKDILRYKLVELNSYIYHGQEYKFTYLNINKAINELDVSHVAGLEEARKSINDILQQGRSYEEIWVDEAKGTFHLGYLDFGKPENNVFHMVENFVIEREDGQGNISIDLVLFINGIPLGIVESDETKLSSIPQLMKYIRMVLEINNYANAVEHVPQNILSLFQPVRLLQNLKG